jgi:arginine repressor
MKMHDNTAESTFQWAQNAIGDATTAVGRTVTKIRNHFKALVVQTKIGKAQSVLQAMDDAQLAKIGIKRSGIRDHAEHLVTYEYDGL